MKEGRNAFEKNNRIAAVEDTVKLALRELDLKINAVQLKLENSKEIKSSWEVSQFESAIKSLCSLSNELNTESVYQSKFVPKWNVRVGISPSQLSFPTSLAIQQTTDNVFVCDREGNRIQVYDSFGDHIRVIDRFNGPFKVFSSDNTSIFAVGTKESRKKHIIELNIETCNTRNIEFPELFGQGSSIITAYPFANVEMFYGIASNPSAVSGGRKNITTVVRFKYSQPVSKYPLITHVSNHALITPVSSHTLPCISKPVPEKCTPIAMVADCNGEHVYVLVQNNQQLILEFSEDCKFIRSFCSSSLLSSPKCVCVDSRGNILVAGSEGDSTKLLCLSPDGDVIHELLLPYEECIGIAVNSKFDVAILCNGKTHGLIAI